MKTPMANGERSARTQFAHAAKMNRQKPVRRPEPAPLQPAASSPEREPGRLERGRHPLEREAQPQKPEAASSKSEKLGLKRQTRCILGEAALYLIQTGQIDDLLRPNHALYECNAHFPPAFTLV